MGNCMVSDVGRQVVRIVTDSGGITELEGPVLVHNVVSDFPGYGIFRQGGFSSPLSENDRLLNGRLYYLLPVHQKREEQKRLAAVEEREKGPETKSGPLRPSAAAESDLLANLTAGPGLEVLPSPGNGVWKVRLVISTDKLAEILAEQGNTQALIEKMRTVASESGATPKRSKGSWGASWRPGISGICKVPA